MTATISYKSANSLRKQHNFCWHLPYFNPSGWFIGVPCHPFETSFVRPSNPIHYVLLDSVWPCFIYHVSPHLIILLSHLHVSIPVKKREVWTNRAGAKSSGRSGSELWTGIQTAEPTKILGVAWHQHYCVSQDSGKWRSLSARRTIFMVLTIFGQLKWTTKCFTKDESC